VKPTFLFLLLFIIACNKNQKNSIVGSWSTVEDGLEDGKFENDSLSDSLVFDNNGILRIYYLENGQPIDSIFGKYSFNYNKQQLITKFKGQRFLSELVEMTDDRLIMRQEGKKSLVKFHRLH
jgi:hypothetical protein